jgi:hypothetical protein
MHISGRLPPAKALEYLETTVGLPGRRAIYVLRLDVLHDEGAQPGSKADPQTLKEYLDGSGRWAVVEVGHGGKNGVIRDLYIAPSGGLDLERLVKMGILPDASVVYNSNFVAIVVASLVR